MRGNRLLLAFVLMASLVLLLGPAAAVQGDSVAVVPAPHGWVRVAPSGFGDPTNTSVSALVVYKNQLYAGTINRTKGASIWRYDGAKWEVVATPGMISTTRNPSITGMIVFNNRLYVGTAWSNLAPANWLYQVWRYDGITWEKVLESGQPVHGFNTFAIYNNELYVGVSTKNDIYPPQGARVLHSPTGDPNSWQVSLTNGNGNMYAFGITSMKVFNNKLYVAVADQWHGIQVWRFDGAAWSTVVNNGFGPNGTNDLNSWDPGGFTVFGNVLMLGIRNEDISQTTSTGGKIFYTLDGTTWNPSVTDGFGNINNVKVEGVVTNNLVAYALTYNRTTGMEVWGSTDALHWQVDRKGGFGDGYNHNSLWTNAQAVYNGNIYIGTSNYSSLEGGQVWMMTPDITYLPVVNR